MKRKKVLSLASFLLTALFMVGATGCKDNKEENSTHENGSVGSGTIEVQPPITDVPQGDFAPDDHNTSIKGDGLLASAITNNFETGTARAPQTSEYLGLVDQIVKPVADIMDERETYGVKEYPTYGTSLKNYTVEERDGIFEESTALLPSPTWRSKGIFNGIDSEGYLIKNGERVSDDNGGYRLLYAHTASESMYGGGLSLDEPRIVKKITALTHTKLSSTQITGLYAPAGEVIKIEMSESEYKAAGGLGVYIGQNYNLDQQVAMEKSGDGIKGTGLNRMSDILSKYELRDANKNVTVNDDGTVTAYVGSFLGGPIYFRPLSNNVERNISVTISGGVKYQHFILGVTTKEEYEFNKNTTAPYFDLEVYDSVRFTTNKYAASGGLALKDYTYENCTDAAILWDKIAEVSTRVAANGLSASSAPVYIIGDCYVAAGAAFANPGRNGVVCPPSWLAEALNYNNFVNSGCWGTMHEYNHCWQGYGFGNSGEVTNNATTLVSYSLYTRISQGRTAATNWGNGGWNRFTDPSKSLADLLSQSSTGNKCFDLPLYATLIHNIGQESFVTAAKGQNNRESGSTLYYNKLVDATHYDMTYYATKILHYNIDETGGIGTFEKASVDAAQAKNYPMFVPVASVYQVGRSILYDGQKREIITAQPFAYGSGEFIMDFTNKNNFSENKFVSKALVIPDGFTVTVKSITQPQNGTVTLLENNQVKFIPNASELYSGNFKVTLSIKKDDNAFEVADVDLIINLKQSTNTTLSRTTYIYDDVLKVPATELVYNHETNTFNFGAYAETESRINVCTQETNTQIWAADRNYYDDVYNKDSTNYRLLEAGKTIQTLDGCMYFNNPGTYRFTLKGRGKATLYLSYDDGATWEKGLTIARTSGNAYINTEYCEHEFTTKNNYVKFMVVLNVSQSNAFFGIGVASKKEDGTFTDFSNARDAFTNPSIHQKVTEESSEKFITEYCFKNVYTYSYLNTNTYFAKTNKVVSVSHDPWDAGQPITNMFDGDANTYYHSKRDLYITEEKPFELVVDLGSVQKVNSVTFYGYKNTVGNNGMPRAFKIYGSTDGNDYKLITEQLESPANARTMTFDFDATEIRYYKLVVTDTDNHRYFAMNRIEFAYKISHPNGTLIAPNNSGVTYTGNWSTKNVLCNFGLIYTAGVGDSVEYHFTGSRFAYSAYQSKDYGTVDIYLDGKLIASDVDLSADKNIGSIAYIYLGDDLSNEEHVVKIVGKSGTFNVESFVCW